MKKFLLILLLLPILTAVKAQQKVAQKPSEPQNLTEGHKGLYIRGHMGVGSLDADYSGAFNFNVSGSNLGLGGIIGYGFNSKSVLGVGMNIDVTSAPEIDQPLADFALDDGIYTKVDIHAGFVWYPWNNFFMGFMGGPSIVVINDNEYSTSVETNAAFGFEVSMGLEYWMSGGVGLGVGVFSSMVNSEVSNAITGTPELKSAIYGLRLYLAIGGN